MHAPASSSIPRVAIIGISGYGTIHLQLAREGRDRGELRIVAVTVINPEEMAADVAELQAGGCEIFTDYEEMLRRHAGQIDLCMVPTGIHWHARMTTAALRAGANVLVEKPLSGVMDEVRLVQEAERAADRFVAVGFQDIYEPGTAWLKSALVGGAIGELRTVRFLGMWPRPRAYFQRNGWAGKLRLGEQAVFDSPLSNAFAHFAMLSLVLAGREPVAAATLEDGELWRAHAIETFDTAVARLRTPEGVAMWFGVTHVCDTTVEPEIVITGTAGRAGWRYEREAWWTDAQGKEHRRALPDAHGARRAMMAATLRRWRDENAPVCTTAMAARHTQLVEALHARIPIKDFPTDEVRWQGTAEAATPVMPGLTTALRQAYESGGLLAETGFPSPPPAR